MELGINGKAAIMAAASKGTYHLTFCRDLGILTYLLTIVHLFNSGRLPRLRLIIGPFRVLSDELQELHVPTNCVVCAHSTLDTYSSATI